MRAFETSCTTSSVRVQWRVTPGKVLLIVLKVGSGSVPTSMRMMVAMVAAIMQCAHGYSGWMGVTISGNHPGSRSVAALSSRSPLRMAVMGRQKLKKYLASKTAISVSFNAAVTAA